MAPNVYDILIVGAGPSGLAAAIAAKHRDLEYAVLEKGVLVNSIYHFPPHMVFFTTPELLEIGGLPLVSPFEKPTRVEALRYYRRVVDTYGLTIETGQQVLGIAQAEASGERLFTVDVRNANGVEARRARAVILAIGYYDHPNLLGVPGESLPHVSHYYTEAHPYYRKPVVVVGGGNSAAEAALELYRAGASVTLVHRRPAVNDTIKYWVLPDIQNRIKEGAIAARFDAQVIEITARAVVIGRAGGREEVPAEGVFLLTGYHPDTELLGRAGVALDPITCMPVHDPDTFETNVPNLFLAGGVMSGRNTAPIFIENGRLHGERVVAVVAARLARPTGTTTTRPSTPSS